MKRPNVQKMRKHRAKSTPDRVQMTFAASAASFYDEIPEVRKFMDTFAKNMHIKHGHEPDIESSLQQDWLQPYPGVFTLELVYKGAKPPFDYLKVIEAAWADHLISPRDARRRFGAGPV